MARDDQAIRPKGGAPRHLLLLPLGVRQGVTLISSDVGGQVLSLLQQKSQSGLPLWDHWLIICLLTQRTWVLSLIWEDSTCLGATKLELLHKRSHCNKE